MRIGVDAFPLCPHFPATGIPRSVREILRELQSFDRQNEYYLYSKLDFDFPLENPRWHKSLHPGIPYLLGTVYVKLKEAFSRRDYHNLDVFWLTRTHAFPIGLPPSVTRVLTVYDLVWLLYPETMDARTLSSFRRFAEKGIRQAHRIISISESTRQGLIERTGAPPDKIDVVHLGADSSFGPRGRAESARFIAAKYGASVDYVCTVGTVEPRKNIVTLIQAMRILRDRGQLRHQLLIAGGSGWNDSNIYASVKSCGLTENEVRFLGRLPESDLPLLYSGAAVFVFPSLYEGFGLPLVEAMASGVPIVASNTSSIPEVVQDAGILVGPQRAEEFASAISRVLEDQTLRDSLVEKGLRRAGDFRWRATAQGVLRILETGSLAASQSPAVE